MNTAVLTPFVGDLATPAGDRLWRKRILPIGQINYHTPEGTRVIRFTKDYLTGLASAFKRRAYDQVPLQLAGDDNKHTNAVERFGGEVKDLALEPDGLYATVQVTERGNQILKENPKCGISARIVENYDRADGNRFTAAIQHVLATLDPRIPGLGGWQAVEASNEAEITVDLSGESFGPEGGAMPELSEEQRRERMAKLLAIDPEQIDKLLASLEQPAPPQGSDELSDEELAELIGAAELEISDEELAAMAAEADQELAAAGATEHSLPPEAEVAIEMAHVRADETERQLSVVTAELDKQRFEKERDALARNHGVPPYITELARPLLEGTGHTIDLSNGTGTVDAGQVIRKVLTEFGKIGKALDLGFELGTPMDEPDGAGAQEAEETRGQIVQGYRKLTGI